MVGPSLAYSSLVLGSGFVLWFLASLLPRVSKLWERKVIQPYQGQPPRSEWNSRKAVQTVEECFVLSFTALAMAIPVWVTSNKEPLWTYGTGLVIVMLGIKPSAVLFFAIYKGATGIASMLEQVQGRERPQRTERKPDDSSLA